MSKAKFTKGPWVVRPIESKSEYIRVRGIELGCRFKVANVFNETKHHDDSLWCKGEVIEAKANANLIACAPEMYEMLIRLLPRCDYDVNGDEAYVDGVDYGDFEYNDPNAPIIGDIRALLAKSRGEHDTNS